MSHSHLHLPSLLDFTPPSSPTRLFESMHWLKRAPTSSPVPPSPTASCSALDNEDDCRLHPPIISPPEPHAQDTTTVAAPPLLLHKNPSMFSLRPKPSSSSLTPSPSATGISCREVARWGFRASPVQRARTLPLPLPLSLLAPGAEELGDHFTRTAIRPSVEETRAQSERRREACQERVRGMRAWLRSAKTAGGSSEEGAVRVTGRSHQRFDSANASFGCCEGGLESDTAVSGCTEGGREDVLWFSLLRRRGRAVVEGQCVGCGEAHGDRLREEGGGVWLVQGCGHVLHGRCLGGLREGRGWRGAAGCRVCSHLGGQLRKCSEKELRVRYNRLLDATGGV